jgi:hypothetical protein
MSSQHEIQMQRLSSSTENSSNNTETTLVDRVEGIAVPTTERSTSPSVYTSPDDKLYATTKFQMSKEGRNPLRYFSLRGVFGGLRDKVLGPPAYSDQNWSRQPLMEDEETGSRRDSSTLASDSESQTTLDDANKNSKGQEGSYQFDKKQFIKDVTIGLADGLTVPFALTAGLSFLGETRTVVTGGTAELFAGAISMGLGGYMAEKSAM